LNDENVLVIERVRKDDATAGSSAPAATAFANGVTTASTVAAPKDDTSTPRSHNKEEED
jgi:hypothetical protein